MSILVAQKQEGGEDEQVGEGGCRDGEAEDQTKECSDISLDNITPRDIPLTMNTKTIESLSPQVVYILLALAVKERHGYEIMKHDSLGKITMGPGTLYGAIKRLLKDGWVVEAGERELVGKVDERRRYYRLTELGRKQLAIELQRYEETLQLARNNHIAASAHGGITDIWR